MPKPKVSRKIHLEAFAKEFPVFKTDGDVLFCKECNVTIVAEKKSQVKQHMESSKHKENTKTNCRKTNQSFLSETINKNNTNQEFCMDLCKTFVAADIPFHKLTNPHVSNFISKYTNFTIPDESNIRKNYVKRLYDETLLAILSEIRNQYLWISIDETTDDTGRYVANAVVGILSSEEHECRKRFFLNTAVLDQTNSSTIARFFDDSVKIFGPDFNRDSILLFVSDAAPYMIKAATAIKIFYPKILHVTCLAHGLHRICEKIRSLFPEVDHMIASMKKVFRKSPSRILMFRETEPNLTLPPRPILTRWGTWIEAVRYYANNFETIENILNKITAEDSAAFEIARNLICNSKTKLKKDLVYISSNYQFLCGSISKLESVGLSLSSQIAIVDEAIKNINNVIGPTGDLIKEKMTDVIRKNSSFDILKTFANIFIGNQTTSTVKHQYTNTEVMAFKFAPITSVDIERTFSMYKHFLRSNRQSFTFDNLRHNFVIYCNEALKLTK